MQNKKRWNIFWTDEAHFYIYGYVNTQNCRIWATENPFGHQPVPLHSEKVSMVRVYGIVYRNDILFRRNRSCESYYLYCGQVYAMNLFCATMSFQHFNSVHVWLAQFSCKTELRHTLQILLRTF
ncbi:hypothetical protein AVEN_252573-1 [Araneus ventricosus]|uniref:Uncharacterized protein n=1 Tax=Araneus ventricosus TaxID=182803 RepID=A0A4Y2ATI7_ARAVE|nr:hypothetical protein AVEN_252573-1 [Araneus ventricosus]